MKTIGTSFFLVKFVKNRAQSFRVVVSKAVAKKATSRNLIRRRLREAVIHSFSTKPSGVVFTAMPSIVGKTYREIKTAVEHTIKKI